MLTRVIIQVACLLIYFVGITHAEQDEARGTCIEENSLLQTRSKLLQKRLDIGQGLERSTQAIGAQSFSGSHDQIHAGVGGLYDSTGSVVDLNGTFPWQVMPEVAECPFMMAFYASWCPHCVRFAPIYSKLAQRIENSSEVFVYTLVAVDCAVMAFADFCQNNSVQFFPDLRNYALGATVDAMTNVSIALTTNETELWEYIVAANNWAVKNLGQTRAHQCASMRSRIEDNQSLWAPGSTIKAKKVEIPHPDIVWLQDQQRALFQLLGAETIRTGALASNRALLPSLQSFLSLAAYAFPDKDTRRRLAADVVPILNDISGRSHLDGDGDLWLDSLAWLEPAKSKNGDEYFGCRGSLPHTRGFTCALWQTFHALLVNAQYDRHESIDAGATHIGLMAIHGWIENFFGCDDCRRHFVQMSENMHFRNVKSDDEAILWLWKAHNSVNERIQNNSDADPSWPKIQFPGPHTCPKCWSSDGKSFHDKHVLEFMRSFYAEGAQWPGKESVLSMGK